ncbi:MAG: hypothetical protein HQK49_17205 [Oligoflexia bacterium]|nr:hypothetical protein [Oligoflexia bacterium]
MKFLNTVYSKYRTWKQRDFLKWREDLSDYEKDFFLPEIRGRCEELLKYCKDINNYCESRIDEKSFGATLRALIINEKLEHLIPQELRPPTPEILAKKFFIETQEMNKDTFINPLERVIKRIDSNISLKEFGEILTEVNHVCSTVVQVKEKLFLYSLSSFAIVFDRYTNQPISAEPKELTLLLVPFKNTIENIYGVANSTSQTIHQWHKEQMTWKTECLSVISQRIAQRNNLFTIFVAIAVSWAFLSATQPLEKYLLKKDNEQINERVIELLKQKQLLENQNKILTIKIEEMNRLKQEEKKLNKVK